MGIRNRVISEEARRAGAGRTFTAFGRDALDQSIPERFEQQVKRFPDRPAVISTRFRCTYAQLNSMGNRVAAGLAESAPGEPQPVVILMDSAQQPVNAIAAIVGVLKAGHCFVPAETDDPIPALEYLLRDSRAQVAITDDSDCEAAILARRCGMTVLDIQQLLTTPEMQNARLPTADSLAYIYYTSGSTGDPKGVADSHRNVLHNVLRYTNTLKLCAEDRLTLLQAFTFSGIVSSLFGALLNGAAVMRYSVRREGMAGLVKWLNDEAVTVYHSVPSIFRAMLAQGDFLPAIRVVRLEGDQAAKRDLTLFRKHFRPESSLVNGLGATECGLVRQYFMTAETRCPDSVLPVGYPVRDMDVQVVDASGRSCDPCQVGELVIASEYLAVGYWQKPDLTAAAFHVDQQTGRRWYRTGDLGWMADDGCLHLVGRQDFQHKVQGQRIDIAAVEDCLRAVSDAAEVVAQTRQTPGGEARLTAYLVGPATLNAVDLRRQLAERLPDAMVPTTYIRLDELPLTPDGKLDRNALPTPEERRHLTTADLPVTGREQELARIWAETLGAAQVGLDDNFFELGGDSLQAQTICVRLREAWGEIHSPAALFERPTVRSFLAGGEVGVNRPAPVSAAPHRKQGPGNDAASDIQIAVIGMACRFPGAASIDEFWELLVQGREGISHFDLSDLAGQVPQEVLKNSRYVPSRGMLNQVDEFDAEFFGISEGEARLLDPQHRVWLEVAWQALESAGVDPAREARAVGVYAGAKESAYLWRNLCTDSAFMQRLLDGEDAQAMRTLNANDRDLLPLRTSFALDLRGPSVNVQTACSTSLVAVAHACQSLVNFQSDLCLAGGVSIVAPAARGYLAQEGGIRSSDGHCRAFGAGADGTVFGDGAGVVVLQRLEDAQAEGRRIEAVIRGWAINNDGANKQSFVAPRTQGQVEVIRSALSSARVKPETIGYVEAHGTGTAIGDLIEVEALTRAFGGKSSSGSRCSLGSVKSNVGHLDTAAGIAGFIKTVLCLRHQQIPATLHAETSNPQIDFSRTPFRVAARSAAWESEQPRRAGVSAFGVGGTNCHIVLEEAPESARRPAPPDESPQLCVLTARDRKALRRHCSRWAKKLDPEKSTLRDVCFSAAMGRARFEHRVAVVADDIQTLQSALLAYANKETRPDLVYGQAQERQASGAVFLFPGQGSQFVGMGRELYAKHRAFRAAFQQCAGLLGSWTDLDLIEHVVTNPEPLTDQAIAQPALFAVEYALAELWQSAGIEPAAVIGHSVGEYAAAVVAGVFSLEDGLRLIAQRGRLMQDGMEPGAMLAVAADQARVEELLGRDEADVAVAAVNAQRAIVVAGPPGALDRFAARLEQAAVGYRPLAVGRAFHSPMVDPILQNLGDAAAEVSYGKPKMPIVAAASGRLQDESMYTADYWVQQARLPVRFADGIQQFKDAGYRTFVEVGPGSALTYLTKVNIGDAYEQVISLRQGKSESAQFLTSLATLFVSGFEPDWKTLYQDCRYVSMPTYPFQRKRYWVQPRSSEAATVNPPEASGHPLLGSPMDLPFSDEVRFEATLSVDRPEYLSHHQLFGTVVVSASTHIANLLLAADTVRERQQFALEQVSFLQPLIVAPDRLTRVQVVVQPGPRERSQLRILSRTETAGNRWLEHVSGRLTEVEAHSESPDSTVPEPRQTSVSGSRFYENQWSNAEGTGPAFRWLVEVWPGDGEAIAKAKVPDACADTAAYRLHPGLLEACFQTLHACGQLETRQELTESNTTYVPLVIESVRLVRQPVGSFFYCRARLREVMDQPAPLVIGDLALLDEQGELLAEIIGFQLRKLKRSALESRPGQDCIQDWYRPRWAAADLPVSERKSARPLVIMTDDREQSWVNACRQCGITATAIALSADTPAVLSEQIQGHDVIMAISPPDRSAPLALLAHWTGALLNVLRALTLNRDHAGSSLLIVTQDAQAVLPGDTPRPDYAPLLAMVRVARHEYPGLRCKVVDTSAPLREVDSLLNEMTRFENDAGVAYRHKTRYVQSLVNYRLKPESSPARLAGTHLLVVGSLGEQGLAVARWLAKQGVARLTFADRLPPSGHASSALVDIKNSGTAIECHTIDLAQQQEASAFLTSLKERAPSLDGILLLAGVMDDGVIANQTRSRLQAAMVHKVATAWHLHTFTADLNLSHFVCFSSSASVLGTPGQLSYAATSAFLDTLAHLRCGMGLPALSINWGPWVSAVAGTREASEAERLKRTWNLLTDEQGLQHLEALLGQKAPQVAVLDAVEDLVATQPAALTEPVHDAGNGASVAAQLGQLLSSVLGLATQPGPDQSLIELGVDSLMALAVRDQIWATWEVDIPMVDLISGITMGQLARQIGERGPGAD